jgi:hypothetical protein
VYCFLVYELEFRLATNSMKERASARARARERERERERERDLLRKTKGGGAFRPHDPQDEVDCPRDDGEPRQRLQVRSASE